MLPNSVHASRLKPYFYLIRTLTGPVTFEPVTGTDEPVTDAPVNADQQLADQASTETGKDIDSQTPLTQQTTPARELFMTLSHKTLSPR